MKYPHRDRYLAIYPQPRGLAFVVLESPSRLIDWGRRSLRTNARATHVARDLATRVAPSAVVVEDPDDPGSRRSQRTRSLVGRVIDELRADGFVTRRVSRLEVCHAFDGRDVSNKDDRAVLLGQLFPALADRVPRRREVWMSESESMGLFDALSLLVAVTGLPSHPEPSQIDRYRALLS